MEVLPRSFHIFHHTGIWRENNEESPSIVKLVYKFLVLLLIFYFSLTELIELFNALQFSSVAELTECLFLTLTFSALCLKLLNLIFRRSNMIQLLNKFRSYSCQPKSEVEHEILQKYAKAAAKIHYFFITLALMTGVVLVFRPLASFRTVPIELPFKTYHPYDVDNSAVNFALTYVMQGFAEIYGVFLNISFDTMTYGFILLASGQFDLCCYRLVNFPENKTARREWIYHHLLILEIVREIESFFIGVVAPLFMSSLITLCASIFQISQFRILSFEFFSLFMYLLWLLSEIFFYCWYGSELQIKSKEIIDAVYDSNWAAVDPRERKTLVIIMMIGQRETRISYSGQCTLSIGTFVWILKTSYAAFNLLKQV